MTDEQADAMPDVPNVPPSPDAEPPLTEHEQRMGEAYVYGKRAGLQGAPLRNPYFAKADEGYAYRSGHVDGMTQRR